MSVIRLDVGGVKLDVRERILKAVEDIRNAAAEYKSHGSGAPTTASIHTFPVRREVSKVAARSIGTSTPSESEKPAKLHLMLPQPHSSIW